MANLPSGEFAGVANLTVAKLPVAELPVANLLGASLPATIILPPLSISMLQILLKYGVSITALKCIL